MVNAQQNSSFTYRKPLFDFRYDKPVLELRDEQKANTNRLLRFSALSGYREGVKPIVGQQDSNFAMDYDKQLQTYRYVMMNLSIQDMFIGFPTDPNDMILEVKDPSKYRYIPAYGDKDAWMRKNAYCFEYMVPRGIINSDLIREELENYFGVKVEFQSRKLKTLILVRTSSVDKIKSDNKGVRSDGKDGYLKNSGLYFLIYNLNKVANMPKVFDETNYTDAVDMDLKVKDWSDIPALRKALAAYDLDLKEEVRERNIWVLKEVN